MESVSGGLQNIENVEKEPVIMNLLKTIRRRYRRLSKKYRRRNAPSPLFVIVHMIQQLLRGIRRNRYLRFVGFCISMVFILTVCAKALSNVKEEDVYAAADDQQIAMDSPQASVPPGINGALTGVKASRVTQDEVERIGTSCEEVIVGQRMRRVEAISTMNASRALEETVNELSYHADEKCAQSTIMSDNDYNTLLAIVEAEAGGEDLKGRIMVANVILNRVKSDQFPDSVYEVVWEVVNGMAQFSPTEDGRISTVTVSDTTVEAVKAAIEGTDYSQGALFFVAKDQANKENVKWFDSDLKLLFEHGVHTFYTYPES